VSGAVYFVTGGAVTGNAAVGSVAMGSAVLGNIKLSALALIDMLYTYYWTLSVLIALLLIIAYLFISKTKNVFSVSSVPVCVVFVAAIIYTIAVTILAPYKTLRYSMPVYPFFVFLPVTLIAAIKSKRMQAVFMGILCISFLFNVFNENKIENVDKNKYAEYQFTSEKNLPVFVVGVGANYSLSTYLVDEQTYVFIDSMNDIAENPYTDFYVVSWKWESTFNAVKETIDQSQYMVISEFTVDNWSGMRVQRIR
jgi:hypothetical protein